MVGRFAISMLDYGEFSVQELKEIRSVRPLKSYMI